MILSFTQIMMSIFLMAKSTLDFINYAYLFADAEQCQSHSECIHLGLGYQCIDSICHCQHGFTYMNTTNSCIGNFQLLLSYLF